MSTEPRSGGRRFPRLGRRREHHEEIEHHIAERVDFLVGRGWEPEAARREAMRRFGDPEGVRRAMSVAGRRRGDVLADLWRSLGGDARYALRGLVARPGFVAAVTATLALGVGATTAIFAIVDALILRPMPYRDADRWVEVLQERGEGYLDLAVDDAVVRSLTAASEDVLDAWVAFSSQTIVRTDGPGAEALSVVAVTPGADTLLGIPVVIGRAFTTGDARPGADPVAMLSDAYWRRTGADPAVVGRTVRLETGPVTVVGVFDGDVRFPSYGGPRDMWLPLREDFSYVGASRRRSVVQGLWARLPSGLDHDLAEERARAAALAIQEADPPERPWNVGLRRLGANRANADDERALRILAATVGVLFLIALVNGVNLLLVRAIARAREVSVRIALGASRWRLLRQHLTEGLALGSCGGLCALALVAATFPALRSILPSGLLYFTPHTFAVESRTLAFAFLVSLAAGVALGLVPWLHAAGRHRTVGAVGDAGDDTAGARRIRQALVVGQLALSMTLVGVAGLLTHSFAKLLSVDPGFDYERIAQATLRPSDVRYPDGAARAEMLRRLEAALEAHPSIERVSVSTAGGFRSGSDLEAEGAAPPDAQPELVPFRSVGRDFFETTGVEIVEGRALGPEDADTDNVMVDDDLAVFLWPGRSSVGRRFRLGPEGEWLTVVGVFGELALMGRDERDWPYQILYPMNPDRVSSYAEVSMRTSGQADALLPVFRETLRSIDSEQWVWRLRTAADALAEEEDDRRFVLTVMSLLAAIAVSLAAVGLYGVLAYSVSRRARELGIRRALGADPGSLRALVVGEGIRVAVLGLALGLLGARTATRMVEQLLYGIEPGDPLTSAVVGLLLLVVAAAAVAAPAWRATRVDPAEVLRAE